MNKKFARLKLIGITYNQIEKGVYALILEDVKTHVRLPIVIGYPEAQSIECRLQNVKPPRPLSHDLMAEIIRKLEGTLRHIFINRLPNGVFTATVTLESNIGETISLDARSSDAIALAIRMNAPIYTSYELLDQVGLASDTKIGANPGILNRMEKEAPEAEGTSYSLLTNLELEEKLREAVGREEYEAAAEIKREMEKRKNKDNLDIF